MKPQATKASQKTFTPVDHNMKLLRSPLSPVGMELVWNSESPVWPEHLKQDLSKQLRMLDYCNW